MPSPHLSEVQSVLDPVRAELLQAIIVPYKEHCKYLKTAAVELDAAGRPAAGGEGLVRIRGEFSIPESCYIASTGHFNSVEFNICYNQLVYVLLGYCVEKQLFAELAEFDLDSYFRRQLPDILIVNFSSAFKRPIHSLSFSADLVIKRFIKRRELLMIKTACRFYDAHNGYADGDITLAIVNSAQLQAAHEKAHQELAAL